MQESGIPFHPGIALGGVLPPGFLTNLADEAQLKNSTKSMEQVVENCRTRLAQIDDMINETKEDPDMKTGNDFNDMGKATLKSLTLNRMKLHAMIFGGDYPKDADQLEVKGQSVNYKTPPEKGNVSIVPNHDSYNARLLAAKMKQMNAAASDQFGDFSLSVASPIDTATSEVVSVPLAFPSTKFHSEYFESKDSHESSSSKSSSLSASASFGSPCVKASVSASIQKSVKKMKNDSSCQKILIITCSVSTGKVKKFKKIQYDAEGMKSVFNSKRQENLELRHVPLGMVFQNMKGMDYCRMTGSLDSVVRYEEGVFISEQSQEEKIAMIKANRAEVLKSVTYSYKLAGAELNALMVKYIKFHTGIQIKGLKKTDVDLDSDAALVIDGFNTIAQSGIDDDQKDKSFTRSERLHLFHDSASLARKLQERKLLFNEMGLLGADIADGNADLATVVLGRNKVLTTTYVTLAYYLSNPIQDPDARVYYAGQHYMLTDMYLKPDVKPGTYIAGRYILYKDDKHFVPIDSFEEYMVQLPVYTQMLTEAVLGGVLVGCVTFKKSDKSEAEEAASASSYSASLSVKSFFYRGSASVSRSSSSNSSSASSESRTNIVVDFQSLGACPSFSRETLSSGQFQKKFDFSPNTTPNMSDADIQELAAADILRQKKNKSADDEKKIAAADSKAKIKGEERMEALQAQTNAYEMVQSDVQIYGIESLNEAFESYIQLMRTDENAGMPMGFNYTTKILTGDALDDSFDESKQSSEITKENFRLFNKETEKLLDDELQKAAEAKAGGGEEEKKDGGN